MWLTLSSLDFPCMQLMLASMLLVVSSVMAFFWRSRWRGVWWSSSVLSCLLFYYICSYESRDLILVVQVYT